MSYDEKDLYSPRDPNPNWGWSKSEVIPFDSGYKRLIIKQKRYMKELEAQIGDEGVPYEVVEKEVVVNGKKVVMPVKVFKSTASMEIQCSVAIVGCGKNLVDG